jgi:hypothetical protein
MAAFILRSKWKEIFFCIERDIETNTAGGQKRDFLLY